MLPKMIQIGAAVIGVQAVGPIGTEHSPLVRSHGLQGHIYPTRWGAMLLCYFCFNFVLICLHSSLSASFIMVLSKIEDALIFVWR